MKIYFTKIFKKKPPIHPGRIITLIFQGVLSFIFLDTSLTALANEGTPSLESLVDRSPEIDAHNAIRLGRFRFLGIGGYASSVPGVDTGNCIVDRELVDIIPGTDDFPASGTKADLNRAKNYSRKFNRIVKKHFKGRIPIVCAKK